MKTVTKKTAQQYDETNVPGGYCMTGKFMNDKEAVEMAEIIEKHKATLKKKHSKTTQQK
jgi:hypothetical protein